MAERVQIAMKTHCGGRAATLLSRGGSRPGQQRPGGGSGQPGRTRLQEKGLVRDLRLLSTAHGFQEPSSSIWLFRFNEFGIQPPAL